MRILDYITTGINVLLASVILQKQYLILKTFQLKLTQLKQNFIQLQQNDLCIVCWKKLKLKIGLN